MGKDHIANGDITIIRDQQPKDRDDAGHSHLPDLLTRNIIRRANLDEYRGAL